jgi:hypothetical protein
MCGGAGTRPSPASRESQSEAIFAVGALNISGRDSAGLGCDAVRASRFIAKNALVKNPAILDTLAWSNYRLGD